MSAHRFEPMAARRQVAEVLSSPPAQPHILRPLADGVLIGSWVLPLELAPALNQLAEMPGWSRQATKKSALALMLAQSEMRRASAPLRGRPVVRALRLSSVEPDRDSGWPKVPVDRLCVGRRTNKNRIHPQVWKAMVARMPPVGLGWLRDDRPSALDLRSWWEPAPPGHGLVYLELWTGEPSLGALGAEPNTQPRQQCGARTRTRSTQEQARPSIADEPRSNVHPYASTTAEEDHVHCTKG